MSEQPPITTEKRKLEEFKSIEEILDALRAANEKDLTKKRLNDSLIKLIEENDQKGEVSPVTIRMAMQSLGYEVPSMEKLDIFTNKLKEKDGVGV